MKRAILSLMLLVGLLASPVAGTAAQPAATDQTYVSEITGDEFDLGTSGNITWLTDSFDLRETVSFQEEYIWFTYNWSNFQIVLIGGPNESDVYHDTTLNNMEEFYDTWELIDEEVTEDHSWFLGEAEYQGSPLVVYYEFELDAFGDIDMAFMQFTDASTLQGDLEFVQEEVTIAGDPILPNTDAAAIGSLVTGDSTTDDDDEQSGTTTSSRTSRGGTDEATTPEADDDGDGADSSSRTRTSRGGTEESTTPEAEEDEDGAEGSTRSRTSRGGTDESTTPEAEDDEDGADSSSRLRTSRGGTDATTDDDDDSNSSETEGNSGSSRTSRGGDAITTDEDDDDADSDSTPVSGADWDELGLISDTEWESPTHGHVVTWDAATWEFPVDYEYAIIVSEDPPYDIITLQTTDGLGYVYLTVDQVYESTPRSLVEYWQTEDYQAQISNEVTVLETGTTSKSATMVYETTNSIDEPLVVVLEATFLDDGSIIFSQISAAPSTIHEVYAQYLEGVEINGEPIDPTFTVEDIADISGN